MLFFYSYLFFSFIPHLVLSSSSSSLFIDLNIVPYDSNLTLLCSTILSLYTTTPTSSCQEGGIITNVNLINFEYDSLTLTPVLAIPGVNYDTYPELLNSLLDDANFFKDSKGEVTIVSNVTNWIKLTIPLIILQSVLISLLFLCILCSSSSSSS